MEKKVSLILCATNKASDFTKYNTAQYYVDFMNNYQEFSISALILIQRAWHWKMYLQYAQYAH